MVVSFLVVVFVWGLAARCARWRCLRVCWLLVGGCFCGLGWLWSLCCRCFVVVACLIRTRFQVETECVVDAEQAPNHLGWP